MIRTLLAILLMSSPLLAADAKQVRYVCPGGESFRVDFQPELTTVRGTRNAHVMLRMEGKPSIALPQARAASGAKYSDGYTTFWTQGDKAMVESGTVNVSDCQAEAAPQASLEGRWILSRWGDQAPVRPQGAAFVEFDLAAGRAFGILGCNRFSGAVEHSSPDLQFHGIASTKMACQGSAMELESQFARVLETTAAYRIEEDRLMLLDAVGATIAVLIQP